ncbi:cleavage and polyadenylation specificity factor subunit 2 [Balamuthia mandrillaris]
MTAIVRFRALSGAYSEGPLCYLLEVDDFHILLDCGWTDDFDVDDLEPLRPWIPKIDAVLLSHPDLTHLGALPFLVGKWGLEAPVYATIPVYKMGQMFMYDVYQAKRAVEEFEVFDLDDVDTAFDKIKQLKYSQHLSLNTGSHSTLDITPYPAGHMIGGTVWKIVKETEEIVYAVDYNHKKERHLNPTVLETLNRPTLLITDAYNALVTHSTNRSVRDVELLESVTRALQGGGNVLLPTDTAGRVLELLLCLDQHWAFYKDPRTGQPMSAFSLVLLHHESYNTIEFAKSQLEWMSSAVQKSFDEDRNNPLNFRFVRMCHNLLDLEKLPKPMAVLATMPTLQGGFALELFAMWASDPKNMVIFTDRGLDFKGEELTGTREEERKKEKRLKKVVISTIA